MIARLKHGDLREALKRHGWTQKQAAEFLGMTQQGFGEVINLKRIPKKLTKGQEDKLFKLTGKLPDDLWPEFIRSKEFLKLPKVLESMRDVTPALLEANGLISLPPPLPDEALERKELITFLKEALPTLTAREAELLKSVYWEEETLERTGHKLGVGGDRARKMGIQAIQKLRFQFRKRGLPVPKPPTPERRK